MNVLPRGSKCSSFIHNANYPLIKGKCHFLHGPTGVYVTSMPDSLAVRSPFCIGRIQVKTLVKRPLCALISNLKSN